MKNSLRKTIAFMLTMLLVLNVFPAAAPADTGEYGQLNVRQIKRPQYISIQLHGEDSITLAETAKLAGETLTDDLYFYYTSPDTLQVYWDGYDIKSQWIEGLSTIQPGETGGVWVYDWAAKNGSGEWAYHVEFVGSEGTLYYYVDGTGTKTLAEILRATGVKTSDYDQYILILETEGSYSDYLVPNAMNHTVEFKRTDLPTDGITYKLASANGGVPCPFKIVFLRGDDASNANDGIFTYKIDADNGTSTITGFVNDLDIEKKERL